MPKYSEVNVVKIKKDIQRASDELALAVAWKNKVASEILELKSSFELQKKQSLNALEEIDNSILKLSNEKDILISEINNLQSSKSQLQLEVELITQTVRDEIVKLNNIPTEDPFLKSVQSNLEESLSNLLSKIDTSESDLKNLENKKNNISDVISKLSSRKEMLENKISALDVEAKEKGKNINDILEEKGRLQLQLDALSKREHNISVMEMRLTDDYQKAFARIPSRTNKI